ncbi:MAG: hypothetical protein L3J52_10520 [Proteobacteria bacterium]|nr:hypothetical protein [Pseudomonadota bacterium]
MSIYDAKLAMSIDSKNRHYVVKEIQKRHFINHASKAGFSKAEAHKMIKEIVESTHTVINKVETLLTKDFPTSVSDKIFNGMIKHLKKLK